MRFLLTGRARWAALGVVAVVLLGVVAVAALAGTRTSARAKRLSAPTCSIAKVAGGWGQSLTGTLIGIGPYAAVWRSSVDKQGKVSGTQTSSLNGSTTTATITGTLRVNADCTGTMRVFLSDQSGSLLSGEDWTTVFANHATEMQAVMTSLRLASGKIVPTSVTLNASKIT